jgi:hypothetical protein
MLQMGYRTRIQYTEADKALMWERWRRGESLNSIGRLFDRRHTTVQQMLARTGSIRPPPRRRSRLALTLAEREEISRGVMAGLSVPTALQCSDAACAASSISPVSSGDREGFPASSQARLLASIAK